LKKKERKRVNLLDDSVFEITELKEKKKQNDDSEIKKFFSG